MSICNPYGYCPLHKIWSCEGRPDPETKFNVHMAALEVALARLEKYRHGRCGIYKTEDKVYYICEKKSA